MSMPNHLFLVRHGESEGNIAQAMAWAGDLSAFTDEYVTTPGRQWSLTERGRKQAEIAGTWLQAQIELIEQAAGPSWPVPVRRYASPYRRTKQTAGLLGLRDDGRDAQWYLNRTLRERDWGDIETIPKARFARAPEYALNASKRRIDPLYWRPPGGESISDVADNRVRNFLDTLHRECSGQIVVAVTHGEFIRAARTVLERVDDETYVAWETDPASRIRNCEIFHYSRVDPDTGGTHPRIAYLPASRLPSTR